jgi:hypothetical protein
MRVTPYTIIGFLVGMNGLLGLATVAVIAANGANNPGIGPAQQSAAGGASAPAPLRNGSFEGLDLNGDKRISLAEAAGHNDVVLRFDRADRNRDGKLTQAEFNRVEKLPPPKAEKKGDGPRRQIRRDAASAVPAD